MGSLFRIRFRKNSLRYTGRDYSLPGKYFVTIHTTGTKEWFGNVIIGKMYLSEIGHIATHMWYEIPVHFPFVDLDAFMVMPNHIHGIIDINRLIGTSIVGALHATPLLQHDATPLLQHDATPLPTDDATHSLKEPMSYISPKSGSLSVVIRSYKSVVTKNVHKIDIHFSWQHGFYDTIICTTSKLKRIRKYVLENPQNWNRNK
jgi:putative transposase